MIMKPVHIDGFLLVMIAVSGSIIGISTSDEAFKYVAPNHLWWTRAVAGVVLAAVTALKTFRSTSYADHVAANGHQIAPPEPPKITLDAPLPKP